MRGEGTETNFKGRLIGHEPAFSFLERSFESGRLAHAYLITGPRSVGKAALARAFAAYLLGDAAKLGSHPDFVLVERGVDPKTGKPRRIIAIEQVREARSKLSRRALMGGWQACIIDGAHLMNQSAGNALLKTLEEPQDRTIILLTAPDPDSVLPTVRSRCQGLQLGRVPTDDIRAALAGRGLAPDLADSLARLADGCPGRALRFAEEPGALMAMRELRSELLRLPEADLAERWQVVERLLPKKFGFQESGLKAEAVLDLLAELLRDVLLLRHGRDVGLVHADVTVDLRRWASRGGDPKSALEALSLARRRVRENVGPRAALDCLMAHL